MPDIDIDMFEVQLGAAILLRMVDSLGEEVRVLADGGIKASGYKREHVAVKLNQLLPDDRIDVMIGTHYDEDHLAGLVDVADRFAITQAFLPPVRLPRYPKPGCSLDDAIQMIKNPEEAEGLKYLINLSLEEFEQHRVDLSRIANRASVLLGDKEEEPRHKEELSERAYYDFYPERLFHYLYRNDYWRDPDFDGPFSAESDLSDLNFAVEFRNLQLFQLRKSAQKGAIVAKWLSELTAKLTTKQTPIQALDIVQGIPRFFVWHINQRKFVEEQEKQYTNSCEPKFMLLGPSRSLVARHAKVMPVACYLALERVLPLKPVSASNQLSYVMLFEANGQKILITGDAGCVDFYDNNTKQYYPKLLTSIDNCNVIQVAHHAGYNYQFYNVLLESGYAKGGRPKPYLLLSHATQDCKRPSCEFSSFLGKLNHANQDFTLLTTSQPDANKIASFRTHYFPPTQSQSSNVGDVSLCFHNGVWKVAQHLVKV